MRILIQNSDPRHLDLMTETLTLRGDEAQGAGELPELRHLAAGGTPEAIFLELTAEAVEWGRGFVASHPECRFVYFAPRVDMRELMAGNPDLSILPAPGTALAARCLIATAAADDPACALGDYQLLEIEALGRRTHIFRALQRSIHRPVVLRLLNQEHEIDESAMTAFLEDARAKAAVTHDRVGAVFQALEDRGAIFYTAESIEGPSLHELSSSDRKLPPRQVLEVARTIASAVSHLHSRQINCQSIELRHIHLSGPQSMPRLANPAIAGTPEDGHHGEVAQHTLGLLIPLVDAAASHATEVKAWLENVAARAPGSVDPSGLVGELKQEISRLDALAHAAAPAVASPRKGGSGARLAVIGGIVAAVVIILTLLLRDGKPPPQRVVGDTDAYINFAGGEFSHPERGSIRVEPFNLDKYEVTIRQYAEFLESTAGAPAAHDHTAQARQRADKKDHLPRDWAIYYPIAQAGGTFEGRKLTLDCPVFNVDWWDAYAYAKWRNRRLASEDEWEVAARGKDWRKYPWGNEWSPTNANSADKPAMLDGHQAWSPVDLPEGDRTPEGVAGLAGNVSEWTSSEAVHPEDPGRTIPVVKGGSFGTKSDTDAGKRVSVLSRNEQKPWLGFRTAITLSKP